MAGGEHEQFRDLLNSTHDFPGPYPLTVITITDDAVVAGLRTALEVGRDEPIAAGAWRTRQSAGGRYTSHRVTLVVASADDVLDLYARVRTLRGVVTVL
jgi:putative lipoic acid-binding regulatory protein